MTDQRIDAMHALLEAETRRREKGSVEIERDKLNMEPLTTLVRTMTRAQNQGVLRRITHRSKDVQDKLLQYEVANAIELNILSQSILHLCPQCNHLISRDRFVTTTCESCRMLVTLRKSKQVPFAKFGEGLVEFISKNYWFEHGIDYLLRKKNYQTLCGYHVLGHSGTAHEIDVIGESVRQRLRLFCECKTGDVGANDVFVLAGKMSDIGCSRGYIFTLSESVTKEIGYLARSRNISIVTNVLEHSLEELGKAITEAE
jgi:hypothetical protein